MQPFSLSCDIYIYLESACHDEQMVARDLFYKLGLPSNGNSKHAKLKGMKNKTVSYSLSLVYGEELFWMQVKMVLFSTGANGE